MHYFIVCCALLLPFKLLANSDFPDKLSETGFYESEAYEINYPLWTDGAVKKRFFYIPDGKKINNEKLDSWTYPNGTQFWKNFGGTDGQIETRTLLRKNDEWLFATYKWESDGEAYLVTDEGILDAGFIDSEHNVSLDIPSQQQCTLCHNRNDPRPVGFEGIQLVDKGDTFRNLIEADKFTKSFTTSELDLLRLEGLPASDKYMAGYLQGNCSSCHNEQGYAFFFPWFKVDLSSNSIEATQKRMNGIVKEKAGRILFRTSATDPKMRMPKIGSKIPHPEFQHRLKNWMIEKKVSE